MHTIITAISETLVLFCLESQCYCITFTCCQYMFPLLQRQDAVDNLRAGKTWVLIATEVIARGMDFKGVNCVINYDFPESAAAYIHRIGNKDIWLWLTQTLLPAHTQITMLMPELSSGVYFVSFQTCLIIVPVMFLSLDSCQI